MASSFWGNFYRLFGWHVRANRADDLREERRQLAAEFQRPENRSVRKVPYEEIMQDLATGTPVRALDRKVQAYMSGDDWPPTRPLETVFEQVYQSGADNAWTTSIRGVEKLLQFSCPDVYVSMVLEFGPYRATFLVDGRSYRVKGNSAAMALVAVHFLVGRLRYRGEGGPRDPGPYLATNRFHDKVER